MAKKSFASYRQEKPVKKSKASTSAIENKVAKELKALSDRPDEVLDFTEAPELNFDALGKPLIGKFYRPIKKPISIRMDADVLDWFKEHSHYQKLINKACRLYMRQHQGK